MQMAATIFYHEKQKHLNLWWQAVLLLTVFLVITIGLCVLDRRLLGDEVIWLKPLKFELSVMIHFITLATLATLVAPGRRNGRGWKSITYLVVTAGLFEVLYIFLQAARGRESHYNNATTIESVMYGLMGLGAVVLVVGSFYLGCLLFQEYQSKRNSVLLLSSAIGLTIGSVLTLLIAGYLSSLPTGYAIDQNTQGVLRLPLFSWYLNGEDLRIPHFFATHMMQLLPLYGLWLSRQDAPANDSKTRLVWVAGLYSLFVVSLFAVALAVMA